MTQEQVNEIIKLHNLWLDCKEGGKCADFRGADLQGANLRGANLRGAKFVEANLERAELVEAELVEADFRCADFRGADFRYADLRGADFEGANLEGADFEGAELQNIKADVHFYTVGGIGSVNRQTLYVPELDVVFCGCFTGTMAEFEAKIQQTYPDGNEQYQAAVSYLKSLPKFKQQC